MKRWNGPVGAALAAAQAARRRGSPKDPADSLLLRAAWAAARAAPTGPTVLHLTLMGHPQEVPLLVVRKIWALVRGVSVDHFS